MDKLKKKRGTVRSQVTRLLHRVEKDVQDEPSNSNLLEEGIKQLQRKEEELRILDNEIEDILDTDDLEKELDEVDEYREKISLWIFRLERQIRENQGENSSSSSKESSGRQSPKFPSIQNVKLPRLMILNFDGEATAWQGFWSQFQSAIHNNPHLNPVDKFNYLKSYLEGTAASAVNGLELTEANYEHAVRLLHERFGRKDVIISAHMNNLLNISPVRNSSDLVELRRLYDSCEVHIRSLEALEVTSDKYSTLLCPILMRALPSDILLEFNRKHNGDSDWHVGELLSLLRKEIESRERTVQLSKPLEKEISDSSDKCKRYVVKNTKETYKARKPSVPTASALNTITESNCWFCSQTNHKPEDCQVKTVEEKREILRTQRRCYICLKDNHLARRCRAKVRCLKCNRRHYTSLCMETEPKASISGSGETVLTSIAPVNERRTSVYLQTATVLAKGENSSQIVRCLFDSGSQRSFIHREVSDKLHLKKLGVEELSITSFGKKEADLVIRNKVQVTLQSQIDSRNSLTLDVIETPEISGALLQFPVKGIVEKMDALNLPLADKPFDQKKSPTLLTLIIGADYYWDVFTGNFKRLGGTLVAVETIFGWTIHGPVSTNLVTVNETTLVAKTCVQSNDELISAQLTKLWDLEAIGIVENPVKVCPSEQEAVEQFESSIKFVNGRYRVTLPWKTGMKDELDDNRRVAEKRLEQLNKRFRRNPSFFAQYDDVLQDYLSKGIIERVPRQVNEKELEHTYYLPHGAVIRPERVSTKLRIVFDASSSEKGKLSLNDCLYSGPNLYPNLFQLLLKFRVHRIAFVADIEKAFLQIELENEDRDVTRFLWTVNPFEDTKAGNVVEYRMTRVLFGVTSSPFLLASTLKHHLHKSKKKYPETCKLLEESLYVDDVIGGTDDIDSALTRSLESVHVLKDAGMTLKKWQTNSKELQELWKEKGMSSEDMVSFTPEHTATVKVLGIAWNKKEDTFYFETTELLKFLLQRKNTKRCVLQTIGRIFDPVGFLSPFTIRLKCLMQEIWTLGVDWDDELPESVSDEWEFWCKDLKLLKEIAVPRCYFEGIRENVTSSELHCFCDASLKAYGAVIFLKITAENGDIFTSFVCSKNRVAPLKTVTLPRLELLGALLAVRLNHIVSESLNLKSETRFWTDSMIVLAWIKGAANRYKPFIKNRVQEIQQLSAPSNWFHCAGKENPADLLTRGLTVPDMNNNCLWWNGPTFLNGSRKPSQTFEESNAVDENDLELRAGHETMVLHATSQKLEPFLDIENYSSLNRLIRVSAWVNRFINCVKLKVKGEPSLTTDEIRIARNYWINRTQEEHFELEINALKDKKDVHTSSTLRNLRPFLDDEGILRIEGRISHAKLPYDQKHPVIIPRKSKFTELVCTSAHNKVMHLGVAATLAEIRLKYWIPKGRQIVRKIVNRCLICQRYSARPATEITAPLPKDRMLQTPPFTVTGCDFAGPVYVKTNDQNQKGKAYIALFTCGSTRAVHLELVSDLKTETFLLALKRFVARRGGCSVIYSDNAKTFKKSEKDLKEMYTKLRSSQVGEFLSVKEITWKFITERAAWHGGFWERLIRTIKDCLRKVLGHSLLTFEELSTLLTEVEAVLNSRPLTYVYNEIGEPETMTPNNFLSGAKSLESHLVNADILLNTSTRENLSKRQQYRVKLIQAIWKRWRKQYLLDLRSANVFPKQKQGPTVKKGDVVLLDDQLKSKLLWRLATVEEVYIGRDLKVRSCTVRTAGGKLLKRPVQLLYPLEVQ